MILVLLIRNNECEGMRIVRSIAGVPIRLTTERLCHIVRRHPEMADQDENIIQTIGMNDRRGRATIGRICQNKRE